MIDVEIANEQSSVRVDRSRLTRAARSIAMDHGKDTTRISIALVDDATIHALNRQYLQHDYPTDVLSFVLDDEPGLLEGEVIASGEMAATQAAAYGWAAEDELLLYVVHGVLHLVGFGDKTDADRQRMRCQEQHYLEQFGLHIPDEKVAENRPDNDR